MTAAKLQARGAKRSSGVKFLLLWEGRRTELLEYDTQSEADLGLISYIAREVGPDPHEIDSLFRQSGLYRAKWDEPHYADGRTYGQGTIDKVINSPSQSYQRPIPDAGDSADPDRVEQLAARFQTARERHEGLSSAPPAVFVAPPYLVVGSITKLDGKAKAAGKTSVALDIAAAVITGTSFLGYPAVRGPVIYLTEQTDPVFAPALRRAGLSDHDDLHVLSRDDVRGFSWEEAVAACGLKAKRVQARLVIIDTIHQFAELKEESENSSRAVLRAMVPLQALASENVAVLIVAHDRKSRGEVGESGRGSSAFTGAVDTVVQLTRVEGQGHPTRRVLRALSRFDEVPAEFAIERKRVDAADPTTTRVGVPAEFIFVAVPGSSSQQENAERIAGVLPSPPELGLPIEEILDATGRKKSEPRSAQAPSAHFRLRTRCLSQVHRR